MAELYRNLIVNEKHMYQGVHSKHCTSFFATHFKCLRAEIFQ